MLNISIVIPVLNEESSLSALLPFLREIAPDAGIVVVDGGSSDGSVAVARDFAIVVRSGRGRGVQMNAGASVAGGEALWFLHADVRPHPDSAEAIRLALADPDVAGGAFVYGLDDPAARFRLVEGLSNLKNRLFTLLYGDMGIFARRRVFERMGGYAPIPLMEDMDFSRRLKREGRVVILPHVISTSARRWREEGYLRCAVRSWLLQGAWLCGAPPERLARWYVFK